VSDHEQYCHRDNAPDTKEADDEVLTRIYCESLSCEREALR